MAMSEDTCHHCGKLTWMTWLPEWSGRKCSECGGIEWDDDEMGQCWQNVEAAMDEMELSIRPQTAAALGLYNAVRALFRELSKKL